MKNLYNGFKCFVIPKCKKEFFGQVAWDVPFSLYNRDIYTFYIYIFAS
jgi:hypothetical protein